MSRSSTGHEHAGLWVKSKSLRCDYDECLDQPSYGGWTRSVLYTTEIHSPTTYQKSYDSFLESIQNAYGARPSKVASRRIGSLSRSDCCNWHMIVAGSKHSSGSDYVTDSGLKFMKQDRLCISFCNTLAVAQIKLLGLFKGTHSKYTSNFLYLVSHCDSQRPLRVTTKCSNHQSVILIL